jgi:hypothetical protein
MKYNAKPGKDENAATLERAIGNSQPPGKPDAVKRPKAKPSALAPLKSKRPAANPVKNKPYPGTKKMNYGA